MAKREKARLSKSAAIHGEIAVKPSRSSVAHVDSDDMAAPAIPLQQSQDDVRDEWDRNARELAERFLFLLDRWCPPRGKYKFLEGLTGIAASRWQNLYLGKQLPTLDMLIAFCAYDRPFTYWLMTGDSRTDQLLPPDLSHWEAFQSHRFWLRTQKDKGAVAKPKNQAVASGKKK